MTASPAESVNLRPKATAPVLRRIGSSFDDEWDGLASQEPAAGFMQASFWATFKRIEGYQVQRYGWFEHGDVLSGGATVYAFAKDGGGGSAAAPTIAVCPEGPVVDWEDVEASRAMLRALTAAVRDDFPDAVALRIEPHRPPPRPTVLRNFQRAPIDLTPVHTLMLDLRLSDDELLARMRPKGRYNYRLSQRHDIRVSISASMQDLSTLYRLFTHTAQRQDFYAEPYRFFLNLGAALLPGGHACILQAEWEGETLAAAFVVFYGRRATFLYGGSSPLHREKMPAYALQMEAIAEARRRGCVEYDFYGCDPFGIPDHPYAGFSTFKRQFGGAIVSSIGAQDLLFYDRLASQIIPRLTGRDAAANNGSLELR